jgi:predicted metal-binding protein
MTINSDADAPAGPSPAVSPPDAAAPLRRVTVCTTCDRYDLDAPEPSRGARFATALRQEAERRGVLVAIEAVDCLDGCRSPCNAALRGRGKPLVRLTALTEADAGAVLDLADRHATVSGLEAADVPASLRRRTSVLASRRGRR